MIAIFGNKKQKSKKIDVYFLAFLHGDDSWSRYTVTYLILSLVSVFRRGYLYYIRTKYQ